jgi:hypothetical protein
VLTVDYGWEGLATETIAWLETRLAARAAATEELVRSREIPRDLSAPSSLPHSAPNSPPHSAPKGEGR